MLRPRLTKTLSDRPRTPDIDVDAPEADVTPDMKRDTFDLFNPSDDTVSSMYGRQPSWFTDKGIPALGMGIKEIMSEAWYMVNLHDDPSLGPDPLTGMPRQRFGFDIFGEQLGKSVKADFDLFWNKGNLNVLADYQQSRIVLEQAIQDNGLFDASPAELKASIPDEYMAYEQATQALTARNTAWSEQSLMLGMAKDFVSKYGSKEAFADTLFNRPDKIVVDLADFYTPKLPSGLTAILRKVTPDNKLEIIREAQEWIKYHEGFDLADEVNEYLGHIERNIKLTPDLLSNPSSVLQDRVTGKMLTRSQIEAWDNDPNIYFRVTEPDRLHQQYSVVLAEEGIIRDKYDRAIADRAREEYADEIAELREQLDDGEITPDDFDYEINEFRVLVADDYGNEIMRELKNQSGQEMGIEEVTPSGEDPWLVYTGPNTVKTIEEAEYIASSSGWNWEERQFDSPGVIQVIRGSRMGETYDADGIVIDPEETVAVYDLNNKGERFSTMRNELFYTPQTSLANPK